MLAPPVDNFLTDLGWVRGGALAPSGQQQKRPSQQKVRTDSAPARPAGRACRAARAGVRRAGGSGANLESRIERSVSFEALQSYGRATLGYAIVLPVPAPGFRGKLWARFGSKAYGRDQKPVPNFPGLRPGCRSCFSPSDTQRKTYILYDS